ncbi:hypothetical protein V0U79_04275 [Hyphobacterium sp. HN65]|uniref:Secretin/TonB short N-terminal domain-containing protein n=1 Tax=Hyphobacterium lacteum TaxID=3116575 RepID=A0ABU7LPL4_9PROT|nr:hypothetical protein [Hyphobacterium sp. HN65]MEE2525571.1 hypothetical protein [Hyphobacterium sp. HN65]
MRRHLSLISITAAILAAAPSAMAEITVSEDNGVWGVAAEGEALSEVLEVLRDEAGFRLVGADRLVDDGPVTVDLSGSLGDVLARLLAGFDYALVYGETPETEGRLQRLVLLSGRSGDAPDESQRLRVERIPTELSEEDGERVSDLLQRQVQPLIDAENGSDGSATTETAVASASPSSASPTQNAGSSDYELDPETQAALAEATRRAQQDLQALVNALQAAENNNDN